MRIITSLFLSFCLSACSTFRPQDLNYSEVQPKNKTSPVLYGVYTPPDWKPEERLPLIVFLHGGGGSHHSFERYGSPEFLDQEIISGRLSRFILVTPNGDNGFWENWADGSKHYRDWVLEAIVPKVQQQYNTLPCPENCHLAGISMGGFGVLRFAYFARDDFSSVSAISAPIFNKQQAEQRKQSLLVRLLFPFKRIFGEDITEEFIRSNPYNAWVDNREQRKMRLQIVWGSEDHKGIVESNQLFQQHLVKNGVAHDSFVYEGGHKWKYWVPNFNRVFSFLLQPPSSKTEKEVKLQNR